MRAKAWQAFQLRLNVRRRQPVPQLLSDSFIFFGVAMGDFKIERENMVESQIRTNAITHAGLLRAFYKVPREAFTPPSQRSLAYMDGPLRVENARNGQAARYLLAPMVLAKLAQLAEIESSDKVLDVGCATGYSSAILSHIAAQIVALESDAGLAALAKDALTEQGIGNVEIVTGPIEQGAPDFAPYNVILINGRIEHAPDELLGQLAAGGRLVTVYGNETASKARIFRKIDSNIQVLTAFDIAAPLLDSFALKHSFVF